MQKDYLIKKLKESRLLSEGERVVIGFSGGPDSIFLFELLKEYKKSVDPKLEMCLVHINHMLRGKDADFDEEFSREVARENAVAFFSRKIDVQQKVKELKKGFEEVAREVRYEFFNEVFNEFKGTKIALAHNKDDQIETFLFRMMRGTSLEGLEGIKVQRDVYIRPVLDYYKSDILEYLHRNNIRYTIDKTNFENDYTRNSIRLDLIPFLEKRYNPKVKDKLYDLMCDIRDINEYSSVNLEKYLVGANLSVEKILKENKFIQKKIINEFLNKNNLKTDRYKITSMIELLSANGNKKVSIEKGIFLKKQYNQIVIEKLSSDIENRDVTLATEIEIIESKEIKFGNYILSCEIVENDKSNSVINECKDADNNTFFSTNLKKGDKITVRLRDSGDKFIPTGMNNYKKLKDFFINEKIPQEIRNTLPIVLKEDKIVWIAGVRGSEEFKYQKNSNQKYRVILKLRRN